MLQSGHRFTVAPRSIYRPLWSVNARLSLASASLNAAPAGCRRAASKSTSDTTNDASPQVAGSAPAKLVLPERILLYHAGTGKIVFVACMKLTTVFMSILGCFFGTSVMVNAPEEPVWLGPLIIAGGCVPLLSVGFATSPFAAMVHVRAPAAARASRAHAARWAAHLPRAAEAYVTTLGLLGMRRIYHCAVVDLRRKRRPSPWWNIANLVVANPAPRWAPPAARWVRRQQGQFFIGNQKMGRGWQATAWKQVWEKVPFL